MAKITYQRSVSGGFPGMGASAIRRAPIATSMEINLPKGKAGTLSTRTNNSQGTVTLSTGHGIATDDLVDLFWSGGSRQNVKIGTVSGNSVPIIGSDDFRITIGDNLPAQGTAVVISKTVDFSYIVDTNFHFLTIQFILDNGAIGVGGALHLEDNNLDDADGSITVHVALESGRVQVYDIVDNGDVNPLERNYFGDLAYLWRISNGSGVQDGTLRVLMMHDPTGESSS